MTYTPHVAISDGVESRSISVPLPNGGTRNFPAVAGNPAYEAWLESEGLANAEVQSALDALVPAAEQAVADEAADAEAAAAAEAEKEANIAKVPVLEAAVDDLIVAVVGV